MTKKEMAFLIAKTAVQQAAKGKLSKETAQKALVDIAYFEK